MHDPEALKELFAPFGPIIVRRMFGGAGIYADGVMFALVSDGEIFLKTDELTVPALKANGSRPFTYQARKRRVVMSYWRLPERAIDEPDALVKFARAALGAAARASAVKRPGRGRKQANKKRVGRRLKRPAMPHRARSR